MINRKTAKLVLYLLVLRLCVLVTIVGYNVFHLVLPVQGWKQTKIKLPEMGFKLGDIEKLRPFVTKKKLSGFWEGTAWKTGSHFTEGILDRQYENALEMPPQLYFSIVR